MIEGWYDDGWAEDLESWEELAAAATGPGSRIRPWDCRSSAPTDCWPSTCTGGGTRGTDVACTGSGSAPALRVLREVFHWQPGDLGVLSAQEDDVWPLPGG